jgi:hypothetical protein
MAAVDHDAGETEIDTAFAGFEIRTVIQVQNDRNSFAVVDLFGIFDSALSHIAEQSLVCVFTGTFGNLKNKRGLSLDAGLNDRLELFHIVEVVSGDRVTAFDSFAEEILCVYEAESFVTDHFLLLDIFPVFTYSNGRFNNILSISEISSRAIYFSSQMHLLQNNIPANSSAHSVIQP